MQSRLTIVGHPVHPLLVMFPLGLLVTAVIFDAADLLGGPAILGEVAFSCIAGGLLGGLVAALAGFVDLVAIPDGTRAKRVGVLHGLVNLGVVLLFAVVWMVRMGADHRHVGWGLFAVELVALAGVALGIRFGGQLVDRLSVGADGEAHLRAAGSLRRDVHPLGPIRSAR